jgi:predicted PurR-regulated permease PerM
MHDLLIFFSTIGGISMFGVMGFIVGPIIAALFLTILDIYGIEFKSQLDHAQNLMVGSRAKVISPPSEYRQPEPTP